jgi:invasion protein IalB
MAKSNSVVLSLIVPRLRKLTRLQSAAGLFAFVVAFGCDVGRLAFAQEDVSAEVADSIGVSPETFIDWQVTCGEPPALDGDAEEQVCEMRQEFMMDDPDLSVLKFALQIAEGGSDAVLSLVVPFGMLVSEPITLNLVEARLAELPFHTCMPRGCIATGTINLGDIERLSGEASAKFMMLTESGNPLQARLSLVGFGDAWRRIQNNSKETIATDAGIDGSLTDTEGQLTDLEVGPRVVVEQARVASAPLDTGVRPDRPFTQIGLFGVEANAQNALLQIQRAGLKGEIRYFQLKDRKFWRVLIGPARDAIENSQMLAVAKSFGFNDAYHVRN